MEISPELKHYLNGCLIDKDDVDCVLDIVSGTFSFCPDDIAFEDDNYNEAIKFAYEVMFDKAESLGADAVINTMVQTSTYELIKNRILVSCSGLAVRLKR